MSEWYKDWFSSKFYLELYRHRNDEDARHMVDLIQRSIHCSTSSRVLDIACGAGRHSMELARRGFHVTGLDLSEFLISEAKKNLKHSRERDLHVKFLIRDMRDFNFKGSYDIALNIFTSFGYFDNDEENFKVIRNASDSIKKGGYFVFDFINSRYLARNIVPVTRTKQDGVTLIQTRRIENGFVRKDILIKSKNKKAGYTEVLKLYTPAEFKKVFRRYGLHIIRSFGDYYGNKFNENKSQRLIIIAKKD